MRRKSLSARTGREKVAEGVIVEEAGKNKLGFDLVGTLLFPSTGGEESNSVSEPCDFWHRGWDGGSTGKKKTGGSCREELLCAFCRKDIRLKEEENGAIAPQRNARGGEGP